MSGMSMIDWDNALEAVGDDKVFLLEVLGDLMTEASASISEIKIGLSIRDFNTIMRKSHKLKGSASYLYCNSIKGKAHELQTASEHAMRGIFDDREIELLIININILFESLCDCVTSTKIEIQNVPRRKE